MRTELSNIYSSPTTCTGLRRVAKLIGKFCDEENLERKREFEKEFRSCTKFHKQMLKTTGISVIEAFQQASDTTWALMADHCI